MLCSARRPDLQALAKGVRDCHSHDSSQRSGHGQQAHNAEDADCHTGTRGLDSHRLAFWNHGANLPSPRMVQPYANVGLPAVSNTSVYLAAHFLPFSTETGIVARPPHARLRCVVIECIIHATSNLLGSSGHMLPVQHMNETNPMNSAIFIPVMSCAPRATLCGEGLARRWKPSLGRCRQPSMRWAAATLSHCVMRP